MKILWINDSDIKTTPSGGAEQADYYRVEYGKKLGYNIEYQTRRTFNIESIDSFALIILSNNILFKPKERNIIFQKPYICDSHDHNSWGNIARSNPEIFRNSLLNCWKSPAHRDFLKMFNMGSNNICLPPYIPEIFDIFNKERINDTMCCTFLHYLKGIPNIVDFAKKHPKRILSFYFGRSMPDMLSLLRSTPNCCLKGYIDRDELPDIYNTHKYYIHLPNTLEPSGTTVGEAHICGCELILNDKIGFTSYDWFWDRKEFKYRCNNADKDFWETVSNLGFKP